MNVLVAYASRHGATKGIAERIAGSLVAAGFTTEARSVKDVRDLTGYDAFVIGSAAYMFHWLKEATQFAKRHRAVLAERPVWLFSSGPLGTDPLDAEGRDQKVVTVPKEIPELREAVGARDHRVFFGAYHRDAKPIGFAERFMRLMPAAKDSIPEGDFRDWPEIEAWAGEIARELQPVAVG
jgi:menaquinone-dependent protoporphyrinogen oxidase